MLIPNRLNATQDFKQIERLYAQGLPIDTIVEVSKIDRDTVEGIIQKFQMLNESESADFPEPELGSDFGWMKW